MGVHRAATAVFQRLARSDCLVHGVCHVFDRRRAADRCEHARPRSGDFPPHQAGSALEIRAGPTAAAPTLEEHKFEETLSLTVPEQRQIARFFEPYKVEPDRAVAIFTILRFAAMFGLAAMTYLAFSRASWPQPLLLPLVAALSGWFITIVP